MRALGEGERETERERERETEIIYDSHSPCMCPQFQFCLTHPHLQRQGLRGTIETERRGRELHKLLWARLWRPVGGGMC